MARACENIEQRWCSKAFRLPGALQLLFLLVPQGGSETLIVGNSERQHDARTQSFNDNHESALHEAALKAAEEKPCDRYDLLLGDDPRHANLRIMSQQNIDWDSHITPMNWQSHFPSVPDMADALPVSQKQWRSVKVAFPIYAETSGCWAVLDQSIPFGTCVDEPPPVSGQRFNAGCLGRCGPGCADSTSVSMLSRATLDVLRRNTLSSWGIHCYFHDICGLLLWKVKVLSNEIGPSDVFCGWLLSKAFPQWRRKNGSTSFALKTYEESQSLTVCPSNATSSRLVSRAHTSDDAEFIFLRSMLVVILCKVLSHVWSMLKQSVCWSMLKQSACRLLVINPLSRWSSSNDLTFDYPRKPSFS